MATTLPQETRTIDDAFVTTWYEIRAEAQDNILLANPVDAILKERGCFKPQTGSTLIERTIKYGVGNTPVAVDKGDILPQGVTETETAAFWTFRNNAVAVQRDLISDVENSGSAKIKDYVTKRLTEARQAIVQKNETDRFRAVSTGETGKEWQGLNDIIPPYASSRTGTYGKINRPSTYADSGNLVFVPATGNTWWGGKYKAIVAPKEVNLSTDMTILFNSIFLNQEAPNLIISDQALYELYEQFLVDKTQIVKNESKMLGDLGFTSQTFKGATMIWTPNITAGDMLFLNTNYIECVYRPNLWFSMTGWKDIPLQMERVAHIISAGNMISDQLRRHGRLTSQSVVAG